MYAVDFKSDSICELYTFFIDCQENILYMLYKLEKLKDLHLDMVQEVVGEESQRRSRCDL